MIRKAPILLKNTESPTQRLHQYLDAFVNDGNVPAAGVEALRLTPYFDAMARYLKDAGESDTLVQPYTNRKALAEIFNDMATYTHNTLVSPVILMPASPYTAMRIPPNLDNYGQSGNRLFYRYNVPFDHKKPALFDMLHPRRDFSFGFAQVDDKHKESTVSVSIMLLSPDALDWVADFSPLPMLRALQRVMTAVNHDPLHHLTMPILTGSVAHKFFNQHRTPLRRWAANTFTQVDYEDWAQQTHQKILLHPGNETLVEGIRQNVDRYFDQLARISADMTSLHLAREEAVNYFGMTMLAALTRVFPLDHAVIGHALQRLKETEPAPPTRKQLGRWWAENRDIYDIRREDVIEAYKKHGFDMTAKRGYKNMRLIQLTEMSHRDVLAHTPGLNRRLDNSIDALMVQMVKCAARTVRQGKQASP